VLDSEKCDMLDFGYLGCCCGSEVIVVVFRTRQRPALYRLGSGVTADRPSRHCVSSGYSAACR